MIPAKTELKHEGDFHAGELRTWPGYFIWVGGACTGFSGFITLRGLRHMTGEWSGPIGLTLLACLMSFLIFAYLCRVIPRADSEEQLPMLVLLGGPMLVIVMATSTTMGVLGLAGPEAQRLEQVRLAQQATANLRSIQQHLESRQNVIPLLEKVQVQFENSGIEEASDGGLTGRKRVGKVSTDLSTVAQAFGNSANLLEEDLAKQERALSRAQKAATQMRRITQSTQSNAASVAQAMPGFLSELDHYNTAMTQLEEELSDEDILSPIALAITQQTLTPPTSITAQGRLRQQQVSRALTKMFKSAQQEVEMALEQSTPSLQANTQLHLGSPMACVQAHFMSVLYLAAYPIAFDFLYPLIALLCLSLMHRQVRRRQRQTQPQESSPPPSRTEDRTTWPRPELRAVSTSPASDPLQAQIDAFNNHRRKPSQSAPPATE